MSALGQKQTCAVQEGMSASPPVATAKADIVCDKVRIMKPVTIASVRTHGVRQLLVFCNGKREGDWPCPIISCRSPLHAEETLLIFNSLPLHDLRVATC